MESKMESKMESIERNLINGRDLVEKEWRPSRSECLINYEIHIKFFNQGCVINVGCKSVAFSNIEEGVKALTAYIENPYEENKKWQEVFNNN